MTGMALASRGLQRSSLRRFVGNYGQELVVLLTIVLLFIVVGSYNPRFLSDTNMNSIFSGNAYIAVAAIGMSLVIISGHIGCVRWIHDWCHRHHGRHSTGCLRLSCLGGMVGAGAVFRRRECWCGRPCRLHAHSIHCGDTRYVVGVEGRLDQRHGREHGSQICHPPSRISQWRIFGIGTPAYFMVILTLLAHSTCASPALGAPSMPWAETWKQRARRP